MENLHMEQTIQQENTTIFKDLTKIFKGLQGTNFKNVLANSKFRKLAYIPFMKNSKFGKHDYDILYRKIMYTSDSGQMDFYGFIEAIEVVASKLYPQQFLENKVSVMNKLIK